MRTEDLIALHEHLARPDGPDLIGRGHHIVQPGDPRRRETVLKPLLVRWLQTRFVLNDPPPYLGKAKVSKGFRLVIADRRRRA